MHICNIFCNFASYKIVSVMIQDFLTYLAFNRHYSSCTIRAYRQALTRFAKYAKSNINDPRWSKITEDDFISYVSWMGMSGLSSSSVRLSVSALRQLYQWMIMRGLIKINPCRYIQSPKLSSSLPSAADNDKVMKALSNIKDKQILAIMALMYYSGLRISEARLLTWSSISLDSSSAIVKGKGNKSRVVYINDFTKNALMSIHSSNNDGYVFDISDMDARRCIYMAIGSSSHTLRHAFATNMLTAGMNIESLRVLMGHSSVKTTQIYSHLADTHIRNQYFKFI